MEDRLEEKSNSEHHDELIKGRGNPLFDLDNHLESK